LDLIGFLPQFGSLLWTLLAFVIALSVIVFVHEFGHYIVGRWSGIQAEVFSIGFGPRVWSRIDHRGTRWQIAALPFGGYVKFLGDANAASAGADQEALGRLSPEERRHTMHGAPLWARAATVFAGPAFNFALSILVFAALFMVAGKQTETPVVGELYALPDGSGDLRIGDRILAVGGLETPDYAALNDAVEQADMAPIMSYRVNRDGGELTVDGPVLYPARAESIAPSSAAYDAGLEAGDVILSANGTGLTDFADLRSAVDAAQETPIALSVWRNGKVLAMTLTPRRTDLPLPEGGFETRYMIGIIGSYSFAPATIPLSPFTAGKAAAQQTWFVARSSLSGMWHIVTGAISTCNIRGPIGIAETSGAAASQGIYDFIWFIAVLSTAVGLLNLFPIPMLDGGHLVFYVWEWATGRAPSEAALNVLMTLGVMIVVALMAFGLSNDLTCP
jgi:regulator of sigma E protease